MVLPPEIAGVEALALDLDGTLYQDSVALPGAVHTVRSLRRAGLRLRFLTNSTSRSRADIVARMRALGFGVEEQEVLCPAVAAAAYLREHGLRARLLVSDAARADFAGVAAAGRDGPPPQAVVVGDLGPAWTFERLNTAFCDVLIHDAELIALGRTRYWRTKHGLQLDVGPFVAALEYATDRTARVFGKPDPAFFSAAAASLDLPISRIAMVGDDARADVEAAMQAGMRGVLVRTGKFRPQDLDTVARPHLVIDSIADLVQDRTPP